MPRYEFPAYVPVAQRRARIAREIAKRNEEGDRRRARGDRGTPHREDLLGQGLVRPPRGGAATSRNRLPRGRSVRAKRDRSFTSRSPAKRIDALVQGWILYEVSIAIPCAPEAALEGDRRRACGGEIASLVELLQGKLDGRDEDRHRTPRRGSSRRPRRWRWTARARTAATMCKHVAAVLYGVGARLDTKPELLFVLRGVDHLELHRRRGLGEGHRRAVRDQPSPRERRAIRHLRHRPRDRT